jgi:hypothetical protein
MYSLCIPDTWGSEGVSLCQYFLSYIHIIIPFLLYAIKCISLSVLWLILLSVLWYNLHNTFFPWNIGVYYIQASLSFVSCFWYYLLCGYIVLWPNPLQMFYCFVHTFHRSQFVAPCKLLFYLFYENMLFE